MASGTISKIKQLRQQVEIVSVPQIAGCDYTTVSVNSPSLEPGEQMYGYYLVGKDAAQQLTMYYLGGWALSIYNAYNGTSSATTAEVHWLIM